MDILQVVVEVAYMAPSLVEPQDLVVAVLVEVLLLGVLLMQGILLDLVEVVVEIQQSLAEMVVLVL